MTISGKIVCTYARNAGPPPSRTLTGVTIKNDGMGGDVEVPLADAAEWVSLFEANADRHCTMTYTLPPFVASGVVVG